METGKPEKRSGQLLRMMKAHGVITIALAVAPPMPCTFAPVMRTVLPWMPEEKACATSSASVFAPKVGLVVDAILSVTSKIAFVAVRVRG